MQHSLRLLTTLAILASSVQPAAAEHLGPPSRHYMMRFIEKLQTLPAEEPVLVEEPAQPAKPIISVPPPIHTLTTLMKASSTNLITRAEFVRVVVEELFPAISERSCFEQLDADASPGVDYTLLFSDVRRDAPYGPALCIAMRMGLVRGYGDGAFRPEKPINVAEASKVLSRALGFFGQENDTAPWYSSYMRELRARGILPPHFSPGETLSISDAASLLERIGS